MDHEAKIKLKKMDYQRKLQAKTGRTFDRHSASGLDGSPKKGGRGGKFTWGDVTDDINQALK